MRPFVKSMAWEMERRLRANDYKSGEWEGLDEVLVKLLEEVHELAKAALDGKPGATILHEAADVANVAGMVACYMDGDLPNFNNKFVVIDPDHVDGLTSAVLEEIQKHETDRNPVGNAARRVRVRAAIERYRTGEMV